MTDHWADVRERSRRRYLLKRTTVPVPVDQLERLLADADALVAVVRIAQEQFGEYGQYTNKQMGEALAALPEHLR